MRRLRPTTWRRIRFLAVLVVLAAFLLLMPSRFTAPARVLFNEALGPIETGVYQGVGEALVATGTLTEMFRREDRERALAREVMRLRNERAALEDRLRRLEMDRRSAQELLSKQFPVRAVRAPVSSYGTSALRRSITVRAGGRDGVGPGMAVTADGALVGVVTEAGLRQSRVRLITDPASALPCRLSRTRALCILQGTGAASCRVDWLDRDSFVEEGDLLVTASLEVGGRGGELRLPDGVPAATVERAAREAMRPIFLSVEASPRVDLERLEAVEVLIPHD
jgi:rod shape-determining protein MreC